MRLTQTIIEGIKPNPEKKQWIYAHLSPESKLNAVQVLNRRVKETKKLTIPKKVQPKFLSVSV